MIVWIRSSIYFLFMVITGFIWGAFGFLLYPLPLKWRWPLISSWAKMNLVALRWICGLSYEVHGKENIPDQASIILCKHQSTWETIGLQKIFPHQTWVLKRELLKVPGFGWGLAALEPVAIDRGSRKKAMEQVIEQGTDRLKRGVWLVIFPEGTRTAPGTKNKYKAGGARLAVASGALVVPVAQNAGDFWPRHGFRKYPGVIQVHIGEPIDPEGKTPEQVNQLAEEYIEGIMEKITLTAKD